MDTRGENTFVVQGLHITFHEAFTGKTNTANVYIDTVITGMTVFG